jgi:predicted RNase H-like HicB family nuclease
MKSNDFKNYSYRINLIAEPDGGYTVTVPALSGCVSYGETIEEATKNAKEAIGLHLENLIGHQKKAISENLGKPVFTTFVQIQGHQIKKPSYA